MLFFQSFLNVLIFPFPSDVHLYFIKHTDCLHNIYMKLVNVLHSIGSRCSILVLQKEAKARKETYYNSPLHHVFRNHIFQRLMHITAQQPNVTSINCWSNSCHTFVPLLIPVKNLQRVTCVHAAQNAAEVKDTFPFLWLGSAAVLSRYE